MALSPTVDDVTAKVAALLHVPVERVRPDTPLSELITDSFLLVELVIDLQEEYAVRFEQDDVRRARTVADVVTLLALRAAS
jgi:acyl carrier protein